MTINTWVQKIEQEVLDKYSYCSIYESLRLSEFKYSAYSLSYFDHVLSEYEYKNSRVMFKEIKKREKLLQI